MVAPLRVARKVRRAGAQLAVRAWRPAHRARAPTALDPFADPCHAPPMLTAFDHVNVRTGNLDAMVAFYDDILGLKPGRRPDFAFPGAWLYLGDQAYVHLVGVGSSPEAAGNVTLEHFAFRARGLAAFRERLAARGIAHSVDAVPGFPILQVNFHDPDGNHIHVDFDSDEAV
jgi:catechol 2,3-dioxygenase-like lactoylglutathione lyase family enzyme